MSTRITVVLEYDNDMVISVFGANMFAEIAGSYGKIICR